MRMRGLLLVGLWTTLLAMPGGVAAARKPLRPHREIQQPMTSGVVYLGKVDGYDIGVSNPDPHVAILWVDQIGEAEDGGSTYTQTEYAVRPQRSIQSGVIRASFPSLGAVNLRFRPGGKTKVGHTGKHCRGRSPQTEFGTYRGMVSLRGEDGYFRLRTHTASGTRGRTFRLSCVPGEASKDPTRPLYEYVEPVESFTVSSAGGSIALIRAVSRQDGRFVYLRAAHMQGEDPGAEVQVGALERQPRMAIGHSAWINGGEGTLLTSLPGVHPATATLAPPPPFHGEAAFVENSSISHSWTGTLTISFPGLDLPLTGPGFATSLCVESPFKTPAPCDFRKQPRVPE
jgi:hypothetical protein